MSGSTARLSRSCASPCAACSRTSGDGSLSACTSGSKIDGSRSCMRACIAVSRTSLSESFSAAVSAATMRGSAAARLPPAHWLAGGLFGGLFGDALQRFEVHGCAVNGSLKGSLDGALHDTLRDPLPRGLPTSCTPAWIAPWTALPGPRLGRVPVASCVTLSLTALRDLRRRAARQPRSGSWARVAVPAAVHGGRRLGAATGESVADVRVPPSRHLLGRADGPGLHRRERRQRAGDADRGQRRAEPRDAGARHLRIEDRDQPAFEL